MLTRLRTHLSYANTMATIAVFIALGGGAYAATNLPKNSVGSKQIKKNSIGTSQIKNNAITSPKVKDGSLLSKDFKAGQLPAGPQGIQGIQGIKGNPGLKGDKGDTGPPGPTQGVIHESVSASVPSSTPDSGVITSTLVTTPTSGKLFALARGTYSESCTAGTTVELGIYVDGTAVHGSGRLIAAGAGGTEISVFGLSDTVSAGTHTLSVMGDCTGGNFNGSSVGGDGAIGAIFLGS